MMKRILLKQASFKEEEEEISLEIKKKESKAVL